MNNLTRQINEALGDPVPAPGGDRDRHFGLSMQQRHALTDVGWVDEVDSMATDAAALQDCCHYANQTPADFERAADTGAILRRILGTVEGLIRDGGFNVT